MTDTRDQEDKAILDTLAELEAAGSGVGPRTADRLGRDYTELLGLIPYELEPLTPSAGSRERLLALIQAEEAGVKVVPFQAERGTPPAAGTEVPAAPRQGGAWTQALAAVLSVLAIGLGAMTGWLFKSVQDQEVEIAALRQELRLSEVRYQELTQVRYELLQLREHFSLVTAPGVEVCVLNPVAAGPGVEPLQPLAKGVLYIGSDREWYLKLEGLEREAEGQIYQLWFVSDDRPVSGGTFDVQPGMGVELSSQTMPPGTSAVMVTLESGAGSEPAGPMVLFGDERQQML